MTISETDIPSSDLIDDGYVDVATLKRSSVRGAAINFSTQILRFIIQFAYQIIIMRLLLPKDFGLVAMAAPVLIFVQMFADFGLSQAIVQRKHITHKQLSFLFWFSTFVSAVLSLATIALAPLAALFYGEPKVTAIIMVLGALLFSSGLQSQPTALLTRRMAYGKLAFIGFVSLGLGLGVGIISAMYGYGYWSLVINQAVTSFSSLFMSWKFAKWLPRRPERVKDVKGLIGFGGNLTGFNALNYFSRNLDNILIGRVWGDAQLGLYDRAYKLLLLPLTQIIWPLTSVTLPTLSRSLHDPALYRRAFLRMFESILLFTYPGILFAMCTSQQLILTVIGTRWLPVAPLFAVLAVSGLFAPIGNATGWLYMSQDRTRGMRNWGIISSTLLVVSFIIGLPWGPLGVAISYSSFIILQSPLGWWWATREGPVNLRDILNALLPHCWAGMATLLVVSVLQRFMSQGPLSLALLFVAAHATYAAMLACLPGGRTLFVELWAQVRHLGKIKT